LRRIRQAIGARELLAAVGLGLIAAGLAMVSVPAALCVSGALLFALAVLPLMGRGEG
jgi:hypothetical protein